MSAATRTSKTRWESKLCFFSSLRMTREDEWKRDISAMLRTPHKKVGLMKLTRRKTPSSTIWDKISRMCFMPLKVRIDTWMAMVDLEFLIIRLQEISNNVGNGRWVEFRLAGLGAIQEIIVWLMGNRIEVDHGMSVPLNRKDLDAPSTAAALAWLEIRCILKKKYCNMSDQESMIRSPTCTESSTAEVASAKHFTREQHLLALRISRHTPTEKIVPFVRLRVVSLRSTSTQSEQEMAPATSTAKPIPAERTVLSIEIMKRSGLDPPATTWRAGC